MKPTNPRRSAAVWLVTVLVALSGCAGGVAKQDGSVATVPLTTGQVVSMAMKMERKQAELPPGFPVQVPVIDGTILSASVYGQGNGLWIYEISAPHAPARAIEWYRRAYSNANWVMIAERQADENGVEATTLEIEKGAGARSLVTIRPGEGDTALVEATVGIGAPAGETY